MQKRKKTCKCVLMLLVVISMMFSFMPYEAKADANDVPGIVNGTVYYIENIYNGNDVKTDDALRIWVASEGCITAVSEFNRNCYDGCEINTQQCNKAKAVAIDNLNKKLDAKVSYSEIDGYLSKNDDGELVYVIVVKIMIPAGNESSVVQIERDRSNNQIDERN